MILNIIEKVLSAFMILWFVLTFPKFIVFMFIIGVVFAIGEKIEEKYSLKINKGNIKEI